jgi:hypothetical protein
MTRRPLALLLTFALAGAGCTRGNAADLTGQPDAPQDAEQDGHGVAAAADADSAGIVRSMEVAPELAIREPGALRTVQSAEVYGRTGPDGRPFEVTLRTPGVPPHARGFGTRTLPIALRTGTPSLVQYPCTSCHMGRRIVLDDDRVADAHQDIQPSHPRETGATCATCHAADDVELLALRSGERATLDHAYRVCAQCHFSQTDAWAAGVHGKRLDGWQGRRVIMGCTDCHDPHAPVLEKRLPFRAPLIRRANRTP